MPMRAVTTKADPLSLIGVTRIWPESMPMYGSERELATIASAG